MAQAFGSDDLGNILGVSRETRQNLETHFQLLSQWAKRIDLVGPKELEHYWRRHALDCGQLIRHAPEAAHRWVDLGTGAGFPGLIVAICLKGRPGVLVHLVDTNSKRIAFLREAARATGAPVEIHHLGAEEAVSRLPPQDIVTARAFAPLPRIIQFASPILSRGATGLFLKGAEYSAELAACAQEGWRLNVEAIPSMTDPKARILRITGAARDDGTPE
jgi:16S rRNA (guanine527-N7)-methyltransferase